MQGRDDGQRQFLDVDSVAGHLLPVGRCSLYVWILSADPLQDAGTEFVRPGHEVAAPSQSLRQRVFSNGWHPEARRIPEVALTARDHRGRPKSLGFGSC